MFLEELNLQKLPDNDIALFFTSFLKVFGHRFINNFLSIKVVFVGLDLKTLKVRDFDYDIVSIVIPKDENLNHISNFLDTLLSLRLYDSRYEIGNSQIIN